MNQMSTYVVMITGLTILFYIMGIATNPIIDILLNPAAMNTAEFAKGIILLIGGATGIVLGFFAKNAEIAVMSPIVTIWLIPTLFSFNTVVAKVYEANPILALLVFAPLMFLLVMTIIEYWRGRD